MDIYVDGKITETEVSWFQLVETFHVNTHMHYSLKGEFVENGAENHFEVSGVPLYIRSFSSGNKRKGMLYTLMVGEKEMEPVAELMQ